MSPILDYSVDSPRPGDTPNPGHFVSPRVSLDERQRENDRFAHRNRLISKKETAAISGFTLSTLCAWAARIPPTDQAGWLNSAVRFVADEAEAWIAAG